MKWKLALLILLLPVWVNAQDTWDNWLKNEGFYLLGNKEKEAFKAMSDADKERYVENLWDSLDPDPLTPENEFKTEYMKRLAYVKKNYGIASDRGRVYMLLGKPNSVDSFPNSDKYFPLELWSYYSLGVKGLPSSLDLIFFKRWGSGDYRIYSPLFDGMKALTPSQIDFEDPRQRSMLKAYFDPEIVDAAERVAPGVGVNESEEVRLVLQDPEVLVRLERKEKKPKVETTVVYEGFQADVSTYSVPMEEGILRTSVAMAIPPKYLTFEQDGATFRSRVDLIGRVTDPKGHEILHISDSPAIKMDAADFEKAKGFFFSYLFDSFLLPGKYNLDILYRDYASNAAGRVEKSFEVDPVPADMALLSPLLAFKVSPSNKPDSPFTYGDRQYIPKENAAFNNGQTLVFYTELLNPKRVKLDGTWKLQMGLRKGDHTALELQEDLPLSGSENAVIERRIQLQSLAVGAYQLYVRLSNQQQSYESSAHISIDNDPEQLGRMRVVPTSPRPPEAYHSNIALQYYYQGNYEMAAKHIRIALDFAPTLYAARSLSARIEKERGNVDAAIDAYEKLLLEAPSDSEGFFLVGQWWMEKKDLLKSADHFKKAMELGYYTTEILNLMADVQKQQGNIKDAVSYWEKSLALEPNQPEITKLVSENKKS